MFFPPVKEQSLWLAYLLIAVFFVLIFVFRDTISQWKETCKASLRKGLYDRMIQVSVVGDTAKTSTGFFTVLFNFLDEHFLKPADGGTYDYLKDEDDSDDESEKKDKLGVIEEESEYEDDDDEEEEEEEELEESVKVNEGIPLLE